MEIWDADKVVLFIAFAIPGFVSIKAYELFFPGQPKEPEKLLIDAVAYSSINYALLAWPIYETERSRLHESSPTLYAIFYVFVLLVAPIVWACAVRKVRTTERFQRSFPHPTEKPWDYVFSQRKPYWLIVTLKAGNKIAGRYDSASFASSSPAAEQLYLQECWKINDEGGFERPRTETAGILILSSEIVSVEFFNLRLGDASDRKDPDHGGKQAAAEGLPAAT